jgi:hypothetical protein
MSSDRVTTHGPWVRRTAASAQWKISHQWGHMITDHTDYTVTKSPHGGITLYRTGSPTREFELPSAVVNELVKAITAAHAWIDTETPLDEPEPLGEVDGLTVPDDDDPDAIPLDES